MVRDHVSRRVRDILWFGAPAHRARDGGRVTVSALDDLLFFCVLGVVLGGRLGYVLFYKPAYYFSHPLEIFAVWQGGMSFHGGFIGVLLAIGWVARKHGLRWIELLDFFAPLAPLALAAGRIGNFINGELPAASPTYPGACCSAGRGRSAPPLAALPVRPRRGAPVRDPVDLFGEAAAEGSGNGGVPPRLRGVPFRRRVLSRAR